MIIDIINGIITNISIAISIINATLKTISTGV